VRALQCTPFRAKSAKNDLKPTNFLKRNFNFEMEGVVVNQIIDQGVDHVGLPMGKLLDLPPPPKT
jgi:hypothetical protein